MEDRIGARIAYWRKRRGGMTQAVLAGLAGLSQPYISQVESGRKGIDRRSTLIAIASALQVSVADLLGQPGDPTDPAKSHATASVPAIRVALIEIEEGARRTPTRTTEEMEAALGHVDQLRLTSDYATLAGLLPGLLYDAAAYGGLALTRVAYSASVTLRNLGYRDLSLSAARIAVTAAHDADHPAWIGATQFVYTIALPIEAAPTAGRIADRALTVLQAHAADTSTRQMLGQVHLSASMACAVDKRNDDALAHIRAAEQEAAALGDPRDGIGFNLLGFGPTNISIWKMTVATELGDYGRTIEVARSINPKALRIANRHQAYWMHLGRALAHSGRTDREALVAFMHAERAAPLAFALHPMVRDSVVTMVYRARHRSVSGELRTLARRLGMEVPA